MEASGVLPGGMEANVRIHNISTTGLLLETDQPLSVGEVLAIDLPQRGPVDATVMWNSEQLYGCAFKDGLTDAALAAAQLQSHPLVEPQAGSAAFRRASSEAFGTRLNRLRRERGLTLAQVADALEVSKPTVWAWEKGKAKPLPERIEAIAAALDVEPSRLRELASANGSENVINEARIRISTSLGTDPSRVRIYIEL
jgi:transcriptional regulator with XRE-family HTH domain